MKLTAIFFIAIALQVSGKSLSQTITLKMNGASIESVFAEVEKQTDFVFVYNKQLLKGIGPVSLDVQDASLNTLIGQVLKELPLEYTIRNRTVFIRKKQTPPNNDISLRLEDQILPPPGVARGIIVDENNEPVIASVLVKGTRRGTASNARGEFELNDVEEDATLVISATNIHTVELRVADHRELLSGRMRIQVSTLTTGLGEVVVVGYGTRSRATVTGSVSTIQAEDLAGRPAARTTDLLQGLAPGVQITRSNAGRIRGTNSAVTVRGITSRSNPGVLIVIDGVMQSENDTYALDNINPNDIENISILKDAQAAIYGARAAGGVILITTKSGKSGKPVIDFSSTYNVQTPSALRKSTNILQLVEMMNESFVNDGQTTNMYTHIQQYIDDNNITMSDVRRNDGSLVVKWPFDNSANLIMADYNWHDIMFGPAPMQTYNLSVSGKTERLNYFNSVGYVDQQSMLNYGDNRNKRLFVRLKNDLKVTRSLEVKTNFSLERQKVTEPFGYETMEIWEGIVWPSHMPYTPGGNLYNYGSITNPIGLVERSGSVSDLYYRLKSQIGMVLTPVKGLTITGQTAMNFDILESDWANLGFDLFNENDVFSYNSNNNRNTAGARYNRSRYALGSLHADYRFRIADAHSVGVMAGYSHEEQDNRFFSAERRLGLISNELPTFGVGSSTEQYAAETKSDRSLRSAFSRLEYGFNDKYLAELTFRYDGSSKFSKGNQWMPFYGVSGAWVVSREHFMDRVSSVIDFLKIRASWGLLGNESSIGLYDHISTINITGSYPMGNSNSPSIAQHAALASMASQIRSWETIETKNLGVDFALLGSRLSGSLDLFLKKNADMFYTSEFPQVLGITPPSINGAVVQTKGWDLNIRWSDKVGAFNYYANFNLSDNVSRVIELADSRNPVQGLNNFVEGYPVGAYFGYRFDGFIQNDAELNAYTSQFTSGIPGALKPGNPRYKDLDQDGRLRPQVYQVDEHGVPTANSGDLEYLGNAAQHLLAGLNLGASYKNFDFGTFFQGVLKWKVLEQNTASTGNVVAPLQYFYGKQWTPTTAQQAVYPRLTQNTAVIVYDYLVSDAPYRMYDSWYMRLKNIQIGYTLPDQMVKRWNLQRLRVYVSGTDLFEVHNLPGVNDPEKPFTNRQFNPVPFPRTYSFGLNLTF